MEWLKRMLCIHGEMKIIEEMTYVTAFYWENSPHVCRKYLICTKCGYKRKISNK